MYDPHESSGLSFKRTQPENQVVSKVILGFKWNERRELTASAFYINKRCYGFPAPN